MNLPYMPMLKEQHKDILKAFESCERFWKEKQNIEARIQLGNLVFLLEEHMESERESFFEKLRPNPRLCEGGPFCSYFFEFFMHNRPLVVAEKMIASRRKHQIKIEIPQSLEVFFKENSLLTIPLEEHVAIQALCKELILAFESDPQTPEAWIHDVFDTLRDLITTNQKKEETCLWVAAKQIMDAKHFAELSSTVCLPKQ